MKKRLLKLFLFISVQLRLAGLSPESEYDILYNDLLNYDTVGYKSAFTEGGFIASGPDVQCQGSLIFNEDKMSVAILGRGYIKVHDNDDVFYTRYGLLEWDPSTKFLVLSLEERQFLTDIYLENLESGSEIRISQDGTVSVIDSSIFQDSVIKKIGKIELYTVERDNIYEYRNNLITTKYEPVPDEKSKLIQGYYESSTVDIRKTMIRMLYLIDRMDTNQIRGREVKEKIIIMFLSYKKDEIHEIMDYTFFLERYYE